MMKYKTSLSRNNVVAHKENGGENVQATKIDVSTNKSEMPHGIKAACTSRTQSAMILSLRVWDKSDSPKTISCAEFHASLCSIFDSMKLHFLCAMSQRVNVFFKIYKHCMQLHCLTEGIKHRIVSRIVVGIVP
jgi:hypothetical protein